MKRCRKADSLDDSMFPADTGLINWMGRKVSREFMLNSWTYLEKVHNAFQGNKEKHNQFLNVLKDFQAKRIDGYNAIERLVTLIDGHPELIVGFSMFVPAMKLDKPMALVQEIKEQFEGDSYSSQLLMKNLNMLIHENKCNYDVQLEVATLLQGSPGLLVAFLYLLSSYSPSTSAEYITSSENFDQDVNSAAPSKRKLRIDECFSYKLNSSCQMGDAFAKSSSHAGDDCENHEMYLQSSLELDSEGSKGDCFPLSVDTADGCVATKKMTPSEGEDKHMAKPIHELELSNCEQCTPSYRLLPKEYMSSASQRNKIDAEVLNDHWISATSGIETYSTRRINPYEESLFKCEDHRYELDMLIESVSVTTQHVEALLKKINNHEIGINDPSNIFSKLTDLDLRCIERVYGEHGIDVVEVLRENPIRALPVILSSMKQKRQEWRKCRSSFNEVWAEVFRQNYHKSLDHIGFQFKQQDPKSFSEKVLLAEIQDIREKNLEDDDLLHSIAPWQRMAVIPHLEFDYSCSSIHEDIYQLIKHVSENVCTSKEFRRVMEIWETTEPILGITHKSLEKEDNGNALENRNHDPKTSAAGVVHSDVSVESGLENTNSLSGEKNVGAENEFDNEGEEDPRRSLEGIRNASEEGGETDENDDVGESQLKAERIADARCANTSLPPEDSLMCAKPLTKYITPALLSKEKDYQILYADNSLYVLFRLHQKLYEKLKLARTNSSAGSKLKILGDDDPSHPYTRFMNALWRLLDGSSDSNSFENECRSIIGAESYILSTLGKLIQELVKQLRTIATEKVGNNLLQLYIYENSRKHDRFSEETYESNARFILQTHQMYRIEYVSSLSRLRIYLMNDQKAEPKRKPVALDPSIADYLLCDDDHPVENDKIRVFLRRNKHRQHPFKDDEFSATCQVMEGVILANGLESKISSNSPKKFHILQRVYFSEDFLYRPKQKRRMLCKSC